MVNLFVDLFVMIARCSWGSLGVQYGAKSGAENQFVVRPAFGPLLDHFWFLFGAFLELFRSRLGEFCVVFSFCLLFPPFRLLFDSASLRLELVPRLVLFVSSFLASRLLFVSSVPS